MKEQSIQVSSELTKASSREGYIIYQAIKGVLALGSQFIFLPCSPVLLQVLGDVVPLLEYRLMALS